MLPDPLHPILVHFPIVLAVLAPLAALGAIVAIRRGASLRRAWSVPVVLLAALAVSGWVTAQSGEREEERVERVVAEKPLESHEEAANLFVLATAGVLVISLAGLVRGPFGSAARVVGALGTVVLVGLGFNVGRSGGDLVYRHGAAQAYVTQGGGAGGAGGAGAEAHDDRDESDD